MPSARTQKIMIFWAMSFLTLYGISMIFLLKMFPLPPANLTASEVTTFYVNNQSSVLLGAAISSWCAGFMVPLSVVVACQMARLEKGVPLWSILQLAGGCLMSIFLVLPPMLWGLAAFNVDRHPDVTQMLHDLGNLSFITTDQYYVFMLIPIAIVSLTQKIDTYSPFPRWLGFYTIWTVVLVEVGVVGYLFKTGPFAWNGLFVYWLPMFAFFSWLNMLVVLLFRAINRQKSA